MKSLYYLTLVHHENLHKWKWGFCNHNRNACLSSYSQITSWYRVPHHAYIHLIAARQVRFSTHTGGVKALHIEVHIFVSIRYCNFDGDNDICRAPALYNSTIDIIVPLAIISMIVLTVTELDFHKLSWTEVLTLGISTAKVRLYPSTFVGRHGANLHVEVCNSIVWTDALVHSPTLSLLYFHQLRGEVRGPICLSVLGSNPLHRLKRREIGERPSIFSHGLLSVNGASRGHTHDLQHENGWQREPNWWHGAWS